MSVIIKAVGEGYKDDKRETLNSLLRVKTPFPKRDCREEICVKIVGCVCTPFKCFEALGMIAAGTILWPIPCTVCKIETEHQGTEVSVKKIYPGFREPNIPCHYEDTYRLEGEVTTTQGTSLSCSFGQRPEGEQKHIYATSSVTGYDCISSGVGKIVNTLLSVACFPVNCIFLACCNPQNSN